MGYMNNHWIEKCVFLDSSSIIRHINKAAKDSNKCVDYHQLKYDVDVISPTVRKPNNSYYSKITALLSNKEIDAFITYETTHIFESNACFGIIQLFKSSGVQGTKDRTVRLKQLVDRELFFAAAQQILKATKIIIDPLFLDFQVGISLSNYIKSSCHVISLGKRIILQKYENEITVLNQTPDKYVEQLFNAINHFD